MPLPVAIAFATIADTGAIAKVHIQSWQLAYRGLLPDDYLDNLAVSARETLWREVLSAGNSTVIKAVENDELIGFICFGESRDADADVGTAEIMAFYVAPEHWRNGIGSALWQSCHLQLKELGYQAVTLWLLVGNIRAARFYEAQGFHLDTGMVESSTIAETTVLEQRYRHFLID
jgi:ribosomal protein S18 acetylase RimI-like enzyme